MLLYGVLGEDEGWDDVLSRQFAKDLQTLDDKARITVRINSPGGSLFTGQAIYSMLSRHKAKITTVVDGIAASAASIVAMAGSTVKMPANAMMMIHNPMTIAFGNQNDFRKTADDLEAMRDTLVNVYAAKTGMANEKIIELLDAETWMSAATAKDFGFIDEIENERTVDASIQNGIMVINGLAFPTQNLKTLPLQLFNSVNITNKIGGTEMIDKDILAKDHKPVYDEVFNLGKEQGAAVAAKTERERIFALQELDSTDVKIHALITAAINDGKTVNEVAVELCKLQKETIAKAKPIVDRTLDAQALANLSQTPPAEGADAEKAETQALIGGAVAYAKKIMGVK